MNDLILVNKQVDSEQNSYWDGRFKRKAVKLLPGDFFACQGEEMIVTVLGSCIAVCLYDTKLKIGGMNHFMLPKCHNLIKTQLSLKEKNEPTKMPRKKRASSNVYETYQHSNAARYGNAAMELLINEIIKLGGDRQNLTAKIFGGGSLTQSSIDVGQRNISFINEYLTLESIANINQDVGGYFARKVYFVPSINEVYVKTIKNIHNNTIEKREFNYRKTLAKSDQNNVFYL